MGWGVGLGFHPESVHVLESGVRYYMQLGGEPMKIYKEFKESEY